MDPQATTTNRLSLLSTISKKTDIGSPSQALLTNTKDEKTHRNPGPLANFTNALMYGIINSILAVPGIYGYAVIIFCHEDFSEFMPALAKLVIFS